MEVATVLFPFKVQEVKIFPKVVIPNIDFINPAMQMSSF
jgi:hypothetical protein